ncbi:hypothetical protein ACFQY0_20250 [Haloferula chungangensis]|uniref:Uncharacterized protein n=1 Tax=Haloferula chungangensis TaxID=1048331 RepID=A0ABW2LD57_9BACT
MKFSFIAMLVFISCGAGLYGYFHRFDEKRSGPREIIGSKIRNGIIYNSDGSSKKIDQGGLILEGSISELLDEANDGKDGSVDKSCNP